MIEEAKKLIGQNMDEIAAGNEKLRSELDRRLVELDLEVRAFEKEYPRSMLASSLRRHLEYARFLLEPPHTREEVRFLIYHTDNYLIQKFFLDQDDIDYNIILAGSTKTYPRLLKVISKHKDPKSRVAVASGLGTTSDILYSMINDPNPKVRMALARCSDMGVVSAIADRDKDPKIRKVAESRHAELSAIAME